MKNASHWQASRAERRPIPSPSALGEAFLTSLLGSGRRRVLAALALSAASVGCERPVDERFAEILDRLECRPFSARVDTSAGHRPPCGRAEWKEVAAGTASRRLPPTEQWGELLLLVPRQTVPLLIDALTAAGELPTDAEELTHLSSALVARAERGGLPGWSLAFETADAAVSADPASQAARFNRALALEGMGLRGLALAAWRETAGLEDDARWRAEEADHITRLERPGRLESFETAWKDFTVGHGPSARTIDTLVGSPGETRERILRETLSSIRAVPSSRHEDEALLARARAAANGLAANALDRTLLKVVEEVSAASRSSDLPPDLLAQALADYSAGARAFDRLDLSAAEEALTRALPALERWAPTLALWSRNWLAGVELHRNRFDEATEGFVEVLAGIDESHLPALAGRAHWGRGMVAYRSGRLPEARHHLELASEHLEASGEHLHRGAVAHMSAVVATELGDWFEASRFLDRARPLLSEYDGTWRLFNLRSADADLAYRTGGRRAAALLLDDSVAVATAARDPVMLSTALIRRSRGTRRWDEKAAKRDLLSARELLARIPDGAMRERIGHDIETSAAWLAPPASGAEKARSARAYYRDQGLELLELSTILSLFEILARSDLSDQALAAFHDALELVEKRRLHLPDADDSLRLTDRFGDAFDRAVELEIRRQNVAEAYRLSRQARQIGLPSKLKTLSLPAHRQGEAEIHFHVAAKRLYTFVSTGTTLSLLETNVGAPELGQSVRRFHREILEGADSQEGVELFELLLAPILRQVGQGTTLLIAPDGPLNSVPFAALPTHDGYLVERNPLVLTTVAPASRREEDPQDRLLVIANPEPVPALGLPRLSDVPEEIRHLQGLYAEHTILGEGPDAKERVLAALPYADVVHVASHSIYDPVRPLQSAFLLAPQEDGSETLRAIDLMGSTRLRARLVVLASCSALASPASRTGKLSGLAAPFLVAGAGAVVGPLWPIDDRSASEFFARFHSLYTATGDAVGSLRDTQLEWIREGRAAFDWAGYQVVVAESG